MKVAPLLLLLVLVTSCAHKNQLSGVAGPFKNEGDTGLILYVNTVENDGDSLDLEFTLKNNYPFTIQVPPNVLSVSFNGQHSTKTLQSHS